MKSLVYYTDNRLREDIAQAVRVQLDRCRNGHGMIAVSQYPVTSWNNRLLNIVMPVDSSILSMFKQILEGVKKSVGEIVFLVEHDVIYHQSHFEFIPPKQDVYYYNKNVWNVDAYSGQALHYDGMKMTSGLVAYRDLLIEHYTKRVERIEKEGFRRQMGFEPGKKLPDGIDNYEYEYFESEYPNVNIKHGNNITKGRFELSQYRCFEQIKDSWVLADDIPYWGKTKGCFSDFLRKLYWEREK